MSKEAQRVSFPVMVASVLLELPQMVSFPLSLVTSASADAFLTAVREAMEGTESAGFDFVVQPLGFTAILSIVLAVVALFLVLAVTVAVRFINDSPQSKSMLRILRSLANLLTTIFFLPTAGVLIRVFACQAEPMIWSGSQTECGSTVHGLLESLVAIVLLLFVTTALLVTVTLVDTNPASQSAAATIHGRLSAMVILLKLVLSFLRRVPAASPTETAYPTRLGIAVFLVASGVMWMGTYSYYLPYMDMRLNALTVATSGVYLWCSVIVLITLSLPAAGFDPGLSVTLGSIAVATAAYFSTMYRLKELANKPLSTVKSSPVLLEFATFWQVYSPYMYPEMLSLHRASAINCFVDTQYHIFMRLKQTQGVGRHHEAGLGGSTMSVIDRLMVDQQTKQIAKMQQLSYKTAARLWQCLAERTVDLDHVATAGMKLNRELDQLNRLFDAVVQSGAASTSLIRSYATFLNDFMSDNTAAMELVNKADRIDEAISRRRRRPIRHCTFGMLYDGRLDERDERAAVIVVSGDTANLGEVLQASVGTCRLVGASAPQELVGSSVHDLVPPPLRDVHAATMDAFSHSIDSDFIGKTRLALVQTLSSTIVPAWMCVTEAPPDADTAAPRFMAVMEPIATREQHLIIGLEDEDFRLYAGSASILGQLGIGVELLRQDQEPIAITSLIPSVAIHTCPGSFVCTEKGISITRPASAVPNPMSVGVDVSPHDEPPLFGSAIGGAYNLATDDGPGTFHELRGALEGGMASDDGGESRPVVVGTNNVVEEQTEAAMRVDLRSLQQMAFQPDTNTIVPIHCQMFSGRRVWKLFVGNMQVTRACGARFGILRLMPFGGRRANPYQLSSAGPSKATMPLGRNHGTDSTGDTHGRDANRAVVREAARLSAVAVSRSVTISTATPQAMEAAGVDGDGTAAVEPGSGSGDEDRPLTPLSRAKSSSSSKMSSTTRLARLLKAQGTRSVPEVRRIRMAIAAVCVLCLVAGTVHLSLMSESDLRLFGLFRGVVASGQRLVATQEVQTSLYSILLEDGGIVEEGGLGAAAAPARLGELATTLHGINAELSRSSDTYRSTAARSEGVTPFPYIQLRAVESVDNLMVGWHSAEPLPNASHPSNRAAGAAAEHPCATYEQCDWRVLSFLAHSGHSFWLSEAAASNISALAIPGDTLAGDQALTPHGRLHFSTVLATLQRQLAVVAAQPAVASTLILDLWQATEYSVSALNAASRLRATDLVSTNRMIRDLLVNGGELAERMQQSLERRASELTIRFTGLIEQVAISGIAVFIVTSTIQVCLLTSLIRRVAWKARQALQLMLLVPRSKCRNLQRSAIRDWRRAQLEEEASDDSDSDREDIVGDEEVGVVVERGEPGTDSGSVSQPPRRRRPTADSRIRSGLHHRLTGGGGAARRGSGKVLPSLQVPSRIEADEQARSHRGLAVALRPHTNSSRFVCKQVAIFTAPTVLVLVWVATLVLYEGIHYRQLADLSHRAVVDSTIHRLVHMYYTKLADATLAASPTVRATAAEDAVAIDQELLLLSRAMMYGGDVTLTRWDEQSISLTPLPETARDGGLYSYAACRGSTDKAACEAVEGGVMQSGLYSAMHQLVQVGRGLVASLPDADSDPQVPLVYGFVPGPYTELRRLSVLGRLHVGPALTRNLLAIEAELVSQLEKMQNNSILITSFFAGFMVIWLVMGPAAASELAKPLQSARALLVLVPAEVRDETVALRLAMRDLVSNPSMQIRSVAFQRAPAEAMKGKEKRSSSTDPR